MASKNRTKKKSKGKKGADITALIRRVNALESKLQLRRMPAGAKPSAPPKAKTTGKAKAEARALEFSLADGSASNVRVTLDQNETVLFGEWSKPSEPREKGMWVSVLIEVIGNEGDTAIVKITNSDPAQLTTPPIPQGATHIADPRVIEAKWAV